MPDFSYRVVLPLAIAFGFAATPGMSHGASVTPNPPSTVCLNGSNCASTKSASSAAIKWHPGQYMSSNIYTTLGNVDGPGNAAGAEKAAEIAIVRAGPAQVLGWEGFYMARALYNAGGTDIDGSSAGSGLDADYVAITGYTNVGKTTSAVYNSPRRMGVYILHSDYFNVNPAGRCEPDFMLNNSAFGAGPSGATPYGWWTTTGATSESGGSVIALWRPSVEVQYAAMLTALANHVLPDGYTVDTSPYIEWVKLYLESTDVPEGASDSTFSDSGYVTQLETLNAAAKKAFPHTNVASTFNYLNIASDAVAFGNSFPGTRTAFSGPDTFGASSGQTIPSGGGLAGYTWGQAVYAGQLPPSGNAFTTPWVSGGTSKKGVVPYIATVEGTELIPSYGNYFAPADIFNQLQNLQATHASWNYLTSGQSGSTSLPAATANWFGTASSQANWSASNSNGVLATIVNSRLSNTSCPSSYTNGCNTN